MTKSIGEDWLGVPALAEELGVKMRTLYQLLNCGELPSYKIGRLIRIRRADVKAFLEQRSVKPDDQGRLVPPRDSGEAFIKSPPEAEGGEEWLSVPRVAEMLGVKAATARSLIERGELAADFTLPEPRPGARRRSMKVHQQDLKAFVQRSRVGPGELAHLYAQNNHGGPTRKR